MKLRHGLSFWASHYAQGCVFQHVPTLGTKTSKLCASMEAYGFQASIGEYSHRNKVASTEHPYPHRSYQIHVSLRSLDSPVFEIFLLKQIALRLERITSIATDPLAFVLLIWGFPKMGYDCRTVAGWSLGFPKGQSKLNIPIASNSSTSMISSMNKQMAILYL